MVAEDFVPMNGTSNEATLRRAIAAARGNHDRRRLALRYGLIVIDALNTDPWWDHLLAFPRPLH